MTLLRPQASALPDARPSSGLPTDLQEQIRGRVRLLAALLFCGFSFDLVVFALKWAAVVLGYPEPPDYRATQPFQIINVGAAAASAGLWWVAGRRWVPAGRLHTLGLAYEVTICFTISILSNWQYFEGNGVLPNLTWVPVVVILFPLIMPGPPRRMLAAAIAAAATSPLSLLILERSGRIVTTEDSYVQATVSGAFAVGFAFMGARIVYGLGKEVAAAREMGSYVLQEKLGQGGMGEVWRAGHRFLARPAAIKVIRQPADRPAPTDEARRRFEREAQAMAGLRSPHTVTLFDFGVTTDGAFYYAMELLDGLDAGTLVRRFGPLPPERVVHLLRQVCHSLSEAHGRGLVHRDVTPANIFVCRYGEDHDFVKVLDFGLVTAASGTPAAAEVVTLATGIHGTPAYMAPEQGMGKPDVDGRADIYALGCVAYWLLTGQQVFTAATAIAVILEHARTAPVPPSARAPKPVPAAMDHVVLACLAKDPAARPQTTGELSARLADAAGTARWSETRARAWWGEHQPAAVRGIESRG